MSHKSFERGARVQFVPESVFNLRRLRERDWQPATYVEPIGGMRGWHRITELSGALTIVPSRRLRRTL